MCKRQCKPQDSVCLMNNTNTVTYQFLSVPTVRNLHTPMVSVTASFCMVILKWIKWNPSWIILGEGVDAINLYKPKRQCTGLENVLANGLACYYTACVQFKYPY